MTSTEIDELKDVLSRIPVESLSKQHLTELRDLLKTPEEKEKERERKEKLRATSKAYREAHADDADFIKKKMDSSVVARKKRYHSDPDFRARCISASRNCSAKKKARLKLDNDSDIKD